MKTLIMTLIIYLFYFTEVFAFPGEFWFLIDDDFITNYNYKVVVTRISMNHPLFGKVNEIDFMEVNSTLYNEVTSDEDRVTSSIPEPFDVRRGFDYLRDPSVWPEIGEGKLEISIYVVYETGGSDLLFSFRLNNLHALTSPDLTFEYSISQPGLLTAKGGSPQVVTPIINGESVEIWNLLGEQQDISRYYNDIQLTNDVNGVAENDIKITFNTAVMGFPDGTAQIGQQYDPGTVVHLWRGVEYGISTSHSTYTKNNVIYNFRNWNEYEMYTTSATLRVLDGTDEFRSMYYATIPLTVANNLEGGSSNNDYEITWQTPPITQTWQYGMPYNAFQYSLFLDLYSATASEQFQALGTTWWFYKWDNGSYNSIRSNLQITSPTTIIANYKGNLRSNDQNGISSASQRKMVRTDNGQYHVVYESMGTVWYTYSLTSNYYGNWSQEEQLHYYGKNPAIDYDGNIVKVVFEEYDTQYGGDAEIHLYTFSPLGNGFYEFSDAEVVADYPNSYYGNAKPVISFSQWEIFIAYRTGPTGGIKQKTKWSDALTWWWGSEIDIPGTNGDCKNPTVTGLRRPSITNIFIAYENFGNIYYRDAKRIAASWDYSDEPVILSSGSGFNLNMHPVISLSNNLGSRYLIVSWLGVFNSQQEKIQMKEQGGSDPMFREAAVVVTGWGSNWGTPSNFSDNVGFTNNGSLNTLYGSIVTWSESEGQYSKYVRRRHPFGYDAIIPLSGNGIQTLVSNGSEFGNIKAMVFDTGTNAPYFLNRCTNDFTYIPDFGKITDGEIVDISYGRSGVVERNGLEFVFNIGDVLLNGETIKFIKRADTIAVNSIEELNASLRSDTLSLNSQSELIFSDYYYVVNADYADSLLSNEFNVNFRCELVKLTTGEVVGVFEQVTYNKNNTEKYGTQGYLVNCLGIEAGNYCLRLTTTVNEEVNLSLSDIQLDEVVLEKSNLVEKNFKGEDIPLEYALDQNYPNPFNPSTKIRYQIPEDGIVALKVYDILGSEVVTLVNDEKPAGKYEISFDASSLASGVYIYRLQAGEFVNVKKMLLLK